MKSDPPKVLISYSHDSTEHSELVLELANRLRRDGIDCMIDQYVVEPEEGWLLWMERQGKTCCIGCAMRISKRFSNNFLSTLIAIC
jgi:SEFIR domain